MTRFLTRSTPMGFQDELAAEGLDGAAIRRAAMTHEATLRDTARTVFSR